MNTTKHTPGPWFTGCHSEAGIQILTWDEKLDRPSGVVCTLHHTTREPGQTVSEEVRANGKLIAMAPELLQSLIELANCAEVFKQDYPTLGYFSRAGIAQAKERIAKATGQTE